MTSQCRTQIWCILRPQSLHSTNLHKRTHFRMDHVGAEKNFLTSTIIIWRFASRCKQCHCMAVGVETATWSEQQDCLSQFNHPPVLAPHQVCLCFRITKCVLNYFCMQQRSIAHGEEYQKVIDDLLKLFILGLKPRSQHIHTYGSWSSVSFFFLSN